MTTEKTVDRLQEAADLLAMVEEILASGMSSRPSVSGGMKITVRHAREAVIRSYVEVRRDQIENKPIPTHQLAPQRTEQTSALPNNALLSTTVAASTISSAENSTTLIADSRGNQKLGDTSESDDQERIALRRRDLRASLEKLVDRNG